MTKNEALEYIHSVSWMGSRPGLSRISELAQKIGNPQDSLRFIHVAGTNGKGSVCAMLESVLRQSGLKTGLYISPYILDFNERMCVDGTPISDAELAEITEYIRPFAKEMSDLPTEFELVTAIAFEFFKRRKVDVVVLETGLGGRLDSTNIIKNPILSIITGIAFDHTALLGNTLSKIASEKAGIIKPCCPVVTGELPLEAYEVIADEAKKQNSRLMTADYSLVSNIRFSLEGTFFDYDGMKDIYLPLLGVYQPHNAATVLSALKLLQQSGIKLTEENIRQGLSKTEWHARFELLKKSPAVIYDGAHNPQGIQAAVSGIKTYFKGKVNLLTGVMSDKDYKNMATCLAEVASKVFTVTPDNQRSLSADEYANEFLSHGVSAKGYESVKTAVTEAIKCSASENTPLVMLGSLYLYKEAKSAFDSLET